MHRLRVCALGMASMIAGTAQAGISGTVTATSDYDFRGISQSGTDVALQGSLDWAHDSGFYLGAWGSNVDFSSEGADFGEDIEVDLYTGFSKSLESGFSWNAGFIYYLYPGAEYPGTSTKLDYWEVSLGGGFKDFAAKFWYSDNFGNFEDVSGTSADAWYAEVNYTIKLPQDFAIGLHAGHSDGDYWGDFDYQDYAVSISKALGHFNLMLKYVYPDVADGAEITADQFNNEDRVLLNVATTFPWTD
jgi:uncharacterized protein (TIGR02001 family)